MLPVRFPALLGLLAAGCADADRGPDVLASDSSGVRIVEYPRGVPAGPVVDVGAIPSIRIGVVEGDPALMFSRIVGAVELSDGQVVVADGTTRELRWFSPDGTHRRTVGGPGDGPGEFSSLSAIARAHGDTVVAYDSRSGRVSYFTSAGAFHGSFSPGEVPGSGPTPEGAFLVERAHVLGAFGDGAVFAQGIVAWPDATTQSRRDPVPLLRTTRDGTEWVVIGTAMTPDFFLTTLDGQGEGMAVPFGRQTRLAVAAESFVVGWGDEQGVHVFSPKGELELVLRPNLARPRITNADVEWERDRSLAELSGDNLRRRQRLWDQVSIPDRMPSHGPIVAGGDQEIWIRHFAEDRESGSFLWEVFSQDGEHIGTVRFPASMRPISVGPNRVLAIETDALDVPVLTIFLRSALSPVETPGA